MAVRPLILRHVHVVILMSNNRVVFITGASSGIGYATALAFARRGAYVVATARRADRLEQLERELKSIGDAHGEIRTLVADVQDAQEIQRAVARAVEFFGKLDILVANAGVGQRGSLVDSNWSDLETVLHTNIEGVLHSIRAAVPAMRQAGGGHIILISSVMSNMPAPYAATYAASKAFVSNLAGSLRLELEKDNIWVTNMRLGQTDTEFAEKRLGQPGRVASRLPTMTAEQVAAAVVRASQRKSNTVVLRWLDRLIILGNTITPGLMGRVARRLYR
jgi:short-subunit dehydrogenase